MDTIADIQAQLQSLTTVDGAEELAGNNPNLINDWLHGELDDSLVSFSQHTVVEQTGLSPTVIQGVLSGAVDEDVLVAYIKIRCPHCSTGYGEFYRKSNIPDETELCFSCQDEFEKRDKVSWNVRYKFK